ncbi:E3 ubiquitin-protein ligase RNF4 [Lethenteron reissneri]|uniref:E3 ubiquitin-protein ligase RNF4 n=1 Tax=Lethenteron reissneri TaxID=7753 RepID=UPI002AB72D60|nr:E3 ubiquitin-protein ligase RNF4 [Lethenteron reissneri]
MCGLWQSTRKEEEEPLSALSLLRVPAPLFPAADVGVMSSECGPGPAEQAAAAAASPQQQRPQEQARARGPKRTSRRARRHGDEPYHPRGTRKRKLHHSGLSGSTRHMWDNPADMETRGPILLPNSEVEHVDVVDLTSETMLVEADVVDLTSLDTTEIIEIESDHSMIEVQRQHSEELEEHDDRLEVLEREFPEVRFLREDNSSEEVTIGEEPGQLVQPMLIISDEDDGDVQLLSPAGPSTRSSTTAQAAGAQRAEKPASEPETTISCPLCLDELNQVHMSGRLMCSTVCGHVFCSVCIRDAIKTMAKCPFCRKKLTLKQYHPIYI